MIVNWSNHKNIRETKAKPVSGSFAIDRNPIEWIHCRERFGPKLVSPYDGFFFSHERKDVNIASFILKTEEVLEISKSIFRKTNRYYATWISPSDFWLQCDVRKSLFTILIRAGVNYDLALDNYEEALFSVKYSKETMLAIQRFLLGFTKVVYKRYNNGWVNVFGGQSIDVIRQRLVLPEGKKPPFPMIAANNIWN